MGNEDRKVVMENIDSVSRDDTKKIEIHGGAGEIGIKVVKVAQWKTKCKNYFNRYYKTSRIIMVPSDGDIIMNTLSILCCDNKGRGFIFKNYDIVKHLTFLGYPEVSLKSNIGASPSRKNISYIAYIEQKNIIFICEKVSSGSNIYQCFRNVADTVKYFLTLYHSQIQGTGVTVIGLLIRENEIQGLVECSFCQLFSPSYKLFESHTSFKIWLNCIETYEGWWKLANTKIQNNLFDDLAAEILCFMAVQEKGLPILTDEKRQQFKQTYFLYNPRQMDIHFSDAKHVIIQGSYGSGKSIMGLKKLELIWKCLRQNEKIIYVNFDHKSNLHFLMEKNVKEYVRISSRKMKRISSIREILESPSQLIYLCHNSRGENLSVVLQDTVGLNMSTSEIGKTNYHLIIEEYNGETLSHDEAAKITKLVKSGDLIESNIMLLAQPLMRCRRWRTGKSNYKKETSMFHKLENTFKIVKLDEVLRCSNQICEITKCMQNFVQNKDSVFKTKMDKLPFEKRLQPEGNKKPMVSPNVQELNYSEVGIPTTKSSNDSKDADKSLDHGVDLDQAFKKSTPVTKSKAAKCEIISEFRFLCEPKQGVDIEGLKPKLFTFSEGINLANDIAAIALALVLQSVIAKTEAVTVLHMADEDPRILRRSIHLLPRLIDETITYTQNIDIYLQEKKQSKMIFSSNFSSVNGMEFDHLIILVNPSEYYLKYYLPQTVSRCTYDLTFVLLPKEEVNTKKGLLQKLSNFFSRTRNDGHEETVANMLKGLIGECLVKQVAVAECKACEKNCYSYSILNETHNKQTFMVHTHSDQYKEHLSHLAEYATLEEQRLAFNSGAHAVAK